MIKYLINEKIKNAVCTIVKNYDEFFEPEFSFLLTKKTKNGRKNIFGVYDKATEKSILSLIIMRMPKYWNMMKLNILKGSLNIMVHVSNLIS